MSKGEIKWEGSERRGGRRGLVSIRRWRTVYVILRVQGVIGKGGKT